MVNISIKQRCFILILLVIVSVVGINAKTQKNIKFELKRNVLQPWAKNNTKYVNDFCFSPKASRPKRPIILDTSMPTNCSEAKVARISQECVFKNLAYNVKFYYDVQANSTATTSEKNAKKLENSKEFIELAIDLTSPWSWVKSPVCQTCDRKGQNCQSNQCKYSQTPALTFDKTLSCNNCKLIEKCGQIDMYAEGMTAVGQFITPEKLRFKDSLQTLSNFKLLWAHALSGQQFLMADGVLGLGIESNLNSQTLMNYKNTPINSNDNKNKDSFREDDSPEDEYDQDADDNEDEEDNEEEDFDEEEEENEKNRMLNKDKQNNENKNNEAKNKKSTKSYEFFEPEMGFISTVTKQFKNLKNKIFSIYFADNQSQLLLGDPITSYIYKPKENKIIYIQSMVNGELVHQYGLWVLKVQNIRIAKDSEEKKSQKKQKQVPEQASNNTDSLLPINTIMVDNSISIISLSTTAIVLPLKDLTPILKIFESDFGLKCQISKDYLFFVICDDIADPKQILQDMTMMIEVGYHTTVHLQINPSNLIHDCKKQKSKYQCQMNLQQSYDDKIILGEAALKNQYLVFNMTNNENLIGFAPSNNKFNNSSFIYKIAHLFAKIGEVIEQDVTYIVSFLILIILSAVALLFFRHGKTLVAVIQGKRVIVVDDKNDRLQLSQYAHETMDESAIRELQDISQQMEDQDIHNDLNAPSASHQNEALKPIDLDDF